MERGSRDNSSALSCLTKLESIYRYLFPTGHICDDTRALSQIQAAPFHARTRREREPRAEAEES